MKNVLRMYPMAMLYSIVVSEHGRDARFKPRLFAQGDVFVSWMQNLPNRNEFKGKGTFD